MSEGYMQITIDTLQLLGQQDHKQLQIRCDKGWNLLYVTDLGLPAGSAKNLDSKGIETDVEYLLVENGEKIWLNSAASSGYLMDFSKDEHGQIKLKVSRK